MLENYVRAGYPAIAITTPEEDRALAEAKSVADRLNMGFATWSSTKSLQVDGKTQSVTDPVSALMAAFKFPHNSIFCLLDFHPYLKSPDVWRTAKDCFSALKSQGIVFVFISVEITIPPELAREIVVMDLPLPSRNDLEELLTSVAKAAGVELPEDQTAVLEAALGLTTGEAENAFALSLVIAGSFSPTLVAREKEQIVRKSGVLEIYSPDVNMNAVGGLDALKSWLKKRVQAYNPKAQEFGLPAPRGVLLVGIPGCGKSLCAKALAAEWQKPLLRLDAGRLFGSLVGESEGNTRRALETAEAVAPAVLWLDEVEKGLAGSQSSGRTDSGVTARVFGHFLTWMQEKKHPVFVVATANDVFALPPEFVRKGRFDEIFFVDLPSEEERADIIRVQLTKYRRDAANFDLSAIIPATESFTGAEIEECIVSGLFTAWDEGRDLATADIIVAAQEITPMAIGMADRIEALRIWAKNTARLANGTTNTHTDRPARVLRMGGECQ